MRHRTALSALLLILASPAVAPAGFVVYDDRSAWEAAVGSWQTETFDGLANGDLAPGVNDAGQVDLIVFAEPSLARLDDAAGPLNVDGSRHFAGTASGLFSDPIGWPGLSFRAPTLAFGADFRLDSRRPGLTLDLAGEQVLAEDYLFAGGGGFLGFVFTDPIDLVVFGVVDPASAAVFGLDNVSFVGLAAVPEPSAALLLAIGLPAASTLARRRRR